MKLLHMCQRIVRGFSDYDVMRMDLYLAQMISAMAKILLQRENSYPKDKQCVEWNQILKDIHIGFAIYCIYGNGGTNEQKALYEKAKRLFNENYYDLWTPELISEGIMWDKTESLKLKGV